MPSPVAVPIVLSADERSQLQVWARRPTCARALRSRVVLVCADSPTAQNVQIAEDLAISRGTVAKWRNRFAVDHLEGLLDEP